jgi:hypothetical protein
MNDLGEDRDDQTGARLSRRKRRRDPEQDKRLSLERDRRNDFGQAPHAARRLIPLHKKAANRAVRRADKTAVEAGLETADAKLDASLKARWRKSPDSALGVHVESKLTERAFLSEPPTTPQRGRARFQAPRLKAALASFAPVLLAATLLAGCQTAETPPVAIAAAFDAKEAAFVKRQGETKIDGHAFLKTPNGTAKNAVGEPVRLIPATAYARERFEKLYGGKKFVPASAYPKTEETDPGYVEAQRVTKTDSNGRFSFESVAPGTYYLATQIVWRPDGAYATQGGAVWEMVTVTGKEDKPIKVIVNGV